MRPRDEGTSEMAQRQRQKRKQTDGEFKIERGVKMPPKIGPCKYPWKDMKPGESFPMRPRKGERLAVLRNRMSCAANYACKRGFGKFTTRQMDGGVRVWRVE